MNEYEIQKPNISRRKLVSFILAFLALLVAGAVVYYKLKINQAKSSDSQPIAFMVSKGSATRQIANSLASKKIIEQPKLFMIYIYLHNAESKIQAGEYQLNSSMPITEIVDILTAGKVAFNGHKLTIIEGWSNQQIAEYLEQRNLNLDQALKENNFDFKFANLAREFSAKGGSLPAGQAGASGGNYQGFLFPDTYLLSIDASTSELVSKMLKNFEAKLSAQNPTGDQIILASIIEKEVGRNKEKITALDRETMQKERELVASVFYNRLERGMPLESDATVNYVTGKADRSVTIADTKIKSPYNTYQNQGLPPAPICNPGLNSILAAIHPAPSDYLYFLNAPDGTAYFAKTLAEHNANKAKYLR